MAEYKQLKIRIWQDNWFLSLSTNEKLLWLFILTNENCHVSGFYELSEVLIEPLTGIKDWDKILLKFVVSEKIYYGHGWIYIKNYKKHQPVSSKVSDNVNKSIKKQFEENDDIFNKIKEENDRYLKGLQAPSKGLQGSVREKESEKRVKNDVKKGQLLDKVSIEKQQKKNVNILANVKENNDVVAKGLQNFSRPLPQVEVEVEVEEEVEYIAEKSARGKKKKKLDKQKSDKETDLEIIPDLLLDKQLHIQRIGLFAKFKGVTFKSKEHQAEFIKRNLRASRSLNAYSNEKIFETLIYLQEHADFKYTISTIGKYIDEDLSKLSNKTNNIIIG